MTLKDAFFTLDNDIVASGQYDLTETLNDIISPFFTREMAIQIVADLKENGTLRDYIVGDTSITVIWPSYRDDKQHVYTFDNIEGQELIRLGAWRWPWVFVSL